MDAAVLHTTDDIEALRSAALSLVATRDALIAQHEHALTYRQAKIDALLMQIARLKRWQFGRRAESMDPAQRILFDEGVNEDLAALTQELDALREPSTDTPRQRPKREALPAHLPRVEDRLVYVCSLWRCSGRHR
jgi:transposase